MKALSEFGAVKKCKRLQNKINYVKLCEKVDFVFNSWYNIYERLGETYGE